MSVVIYKESNRVKNAIEVQADEGTRTMAGAKPKEFSIGEQTEHRFDESKVTIVRPDGYRPNEHLLAETRKLFFLLVGISDFDFPNVKKVAVTIARSTENRDLFYLMKVSHGCDVFNDTLINKNWSTLFNEKIAEFEFELFIEDVSGYQYRDILHVSKLVLLFINEKEDIFSISREDYLLSFSDIPIRVTRDTASGGMDDQPFEKTDPIREPFTASADPKEVGEMLVAARDARDMTKFDVAGQMGRGEKAVRDLENGAYNATLSKIQDYADAVGYDVRVQLIPKTD